MKIPRPKPLAPLTPVTRLLGLASAARKGAANSRLIVAQIAALPAHERVAMSAAAELQVEVARQLEEQSTSDEADAAEIVRCLPPAEAQPYLEHGRPAIRAAAFEAVCATRSNEGRGNPLAP